MNDSLYTDTVDPEPARMINLNVMKRRVRALQQRRQYKQRSVEWFNQRQTRITASEAANCLKKTEIVCRPYISAFNIDSQKFKFNEKSLNSYSTLEDYIIQKCSMFHGIGNTEFKSTPATLWGQKFEDVACKLYSNLYNKKVHEFGLLNHPRLRWLAASPDGITSDGIMLEIKCPSSRKIKENEPPIHYWVQTQIQMEVCNLDECHFFECEFKQVDTEIEFLVLSEDKHPGILLRVKDTHDYIYPPNDITSKEGYIKWRDTVFENNEKYKGYDEYTEYEQVFYYIAAYANTYIKRDKDWFNIVKPMLKQTHDKITLFQNDKVLFENYIENIRMIKSKSFMDKFESTVCVL
jgi:putative phage-type endonuclease